MCARGSGPPRTGRALRRGIGQNPAHGGVGAAHSDYPPRHDPRHRRSHRSVHARRCSREGHRRARRPSRRGASRRHRGRRRAGCLALERQRRRREGVRGLLPAALRGRRRRAHASAGAPRDGARADRRPPLRDAPHPAPTPRPARRRVPRRRRHPGAVRSVARPVGADVQAEDRPSLPAELRSADARDHAARRSVLGRRRLGGRAHRAQLRAAHPRRALRPRAQDIVRVRQVRQPLPRARGRHGRCERQALVRGGPQAHRALAGARGDQGRLRRSRRARQAARAGVGDGAPYRWHHPQARHVGRGEARLESRDKHGRGR